MGDKTYCETKIVDGELYVKGYICVYDDWFATGDLVEYKDDIYWYLGRKNA
jgi:acyl-coenzyme A synthetase/AMP-(fatty) acid ligase